MKFKTTVAAALLAIGAAGSVFADATPYPNAGTQNPTTYTFTSNGGDVMAYFMGSSASYNESLGLLVNGVDSGITGLQNHTAAVGESLDFGVIPAGRTLTFYINVATTGEAGEIAKSVLYLASDQSSFTTGATLSVTGGMGD